MLIASIDFLSRRSESFERHCGVKPRAAFRSDGKMNQSHSLPAKWSVCIAFKVISSVTAVTLMLWSNKQNEGMFFLKPCLK